MATKPLAEGAFFKYPRKGAPAFVIGNLSFKVDTFVQFLQQKVNSRGYVNCDVLIGRTSGEPYIQLNDYDAGRGRSIIDNPPPSREDLSQEQPEEINPDDIPF